MTEKPLRFYRMSGLTCEQLDELEARVTDFLDGSGKYKTTGHGSLIITNLQGRITFVSEPVTGSQHDMAKLKGSDVEDILKVAGGVFGDKRFHRN